MTEGEGRRPPEPDTGAPGSVRLAVLAWWTVLISPPIIPLLVWLQSPRGTLHRGHARAAMTVWASLFVLWVPLGLLALVDEDSSTLVAVGVGIGLGLTVLACIWGTSLALRRALPPGGPERWAGAEASGRMDG